MKKTDKISTDNIVLICSSAMMLISASGLLLFMSGCGSQTPLIAPGIIIFAILCFVREKIDFRIFIIISAVLIIGMLVFSAIKHVQITAGMMTVINRLYDIGEKAQSYVYDRFRIEMNADTRKQCMRLAVCWFGCITGTIVALPSTAVRRWICIGAAAAVMLCLAYFGLLPQPVLAGIMLISLLITASAGKIKTLLPLLILTTLLFSAIIMIDPGESINISRADEQLRDKLAVQTARLEGRQNTAASAGKNNRKNYNNKKLKKFLAGTGLQKKIRRLLIILSLIIFILLILFVPAVIHDHLEEKRKINRSGIDNKDPASAVRAMFPYTLKWLKIYGIEITNRPFNAFIAQVQTDISKEYACRYISMLTLWKEAAYSNHAITEQQRSEMVTFMKDTIEITKKRISLTDKVKIRFNPAL